MANERARRKYFFVVIPSIFVFLSVGKGIEWFQQSANPSPTSLILLSLIPMIAIFAIFWAQWRFINELDEFLRSVQIKAMLCGLGLILAVVSTWGYLEELTLGFEVPRLPMFWLLPLFLATYGVSVRIIKKRGSGTLA